MHWGKVAAIVISECNSDQQRDPKGDAKKDVAQAPKVGIRGLRCANSTIGDKCQGDGRYRDAEKDKVGNGGGGSHSVLRESDNGCQKRYGRDQDEHGGNPRHGG